MPNLTSSNLQESFEQGQVHKQFPAELWIEIAQHLSLRNRAKLCLTCSWFLRILRPLLYRHIYLRQIYVSSTNSSPKSTMDLLARDYELASSVETLSLEVFNNYHYSSLRETPPVVNIDAMKNMTNLLSLKIHGPALYGSNEDAVRKAVELMRSVKKLEVTMPWGAGPDMIIRLASCARSLGHFFDLEEVLWHAGYRFEGGSWNFTSQGMYQLEPLWNTLNHSLDTIHTLSLPFPLAYPDTQSYFFRNYRFSRLRRLTLGDWVPTAQADFHNFIVAHADRLEYLSLHEEIWSSPGMAFDESISQLLNSGSFPSLRAFRGRSESIKAMANAGVQSLHKLEAYVSTSGNKMEMESLYSSIRNTDALTKLKELNFEFVMCSNVSVICRHNSLWASICGASLERWHCGDLAIRQQQDGWGPVKLQEMFRGFYRLEEIRFGDGWIVGGPHYHPSESEVEEYLFRLTLSCPRLQDVHFFMEGQKKCWEIVRTSDGAMSYRQHPPNGRTYRQWSFDL
ncbi:hypothetical protein WG66_011748 [Moniliophthora roreri]|nr:hypothetical protein WG66_011748 [Moniliophthora roreri]